YCSSSPQAGFNPGNSAVDSSLYTCTNGHTTDYAFCLNGCTPAPPGMPDGCSGDPCAKVVAANNGTYCGSSSENGFDNTLSVWNIVYTCTNGHTSDTTFC